MRDCKTCIHSEIGHGDSNGCTAWSCEYVNKKEALKAYKESMEIVRCKDCKWYDPPHIDLGDGKRTDIDEDDKPFVPLSVGTTVGGKCMNIFHDYCCNHDREDPDDYERLTSRAEDRGVDSLH